MRPLCKLEPKIHFFCFHQTHCLRCDSRSYRGASARREFKHASAPAKKGGGPGYTCPMAVQDSKTCPVAFQEGMSFQRKFSVIFFVSRTYAFFHFSPELKSFVFLVYEYSGELQNKYSSCMKSIGTAHIFSQITPAYELALTFHI